MMRAIALALIVAGWALAYAALIATQPDRPPIVPGTLYSTWKGTR